MRWERDSVISANAALQTQLEIAVLALQFYADGKHYFVEDRRTGVIDTGGTAQEALAIIQGEKSVTAEDVDYMRHSIECATTD